MEILKKIIFFLIFIASYSPNAQNIKEVDLQFFNNYQEQKITDKYLNVFVSAKDCYRCFSEIHQILIQIEKNYPNLQVNFISDEVAFVKKNTKDYQLNKKYFLNKDLFKEHTKSFYYLKENNEIIQEYNKILSRLSNKININNNFTTVDIKVVDSLFTSDNIRHAGIFDNNLIVINDKSVDLGGIVNIKKNKIDYYDITTASEKLYNLPFTLELKDFELINYDNFINLKKDLGVPEIKVTAMNVYDDIIYTNFIISRLFKDLKKEGDVGLFSFNYIAVKKITDKSKLSEIFDIETYDNYFSVDHLDFNSKTYRFGGAIYFPFSKMIDKYHFVSQIHQEANFAGDATFELSPNLKTISIVSINSNASKNYIYPSFKIDDKFYYVTKEMIDESSGKGIIVVKESKIVN